MGNYADGNGCRCVLCNSKLNNEQMMTLAANGLVIYAHNYLNRIQTHMQKFDTIQTMYLGLSRMDEPINDKEIVDRFQEMINQNLETKAEVEEKEPAKVLKKEDERLKGLKQIIRKDFEEDE